ncbi:hypothetical protein [Desulfurivibrio dismutans]|uniref:hypothetical protein n=1 Tax=Desulfurivibrio dismutans TaxID=1398908 RepID=UPI0023DAA742|nr:hypothetical protein [Desulfurivibrio alkaliphilus]MDF1613791.1 hypothetical protein [Desulfurivibrio alkaliphilus]
MKWAKFALQLLLLLFLFVPATAVAWECSASIAGPHWVKIGRTITLTAEGLPAGGSYSWSATPNLFPRGSTATLTGYKPSTSDYIRVSMRYATPKGNSCSDTKWIYAHPACEVLVSGPGQAGVGEAVNLGAAADPSDGVFAWRISSGSGSIAGDGPKAVYIGDQPGEVEIEVAYTTSDGAETCKGYHQLSIVEECSLTIDGPSETPLGDTIGLLATGTPDGGSYQWTPLTGLTPSDDHQSGTAYFTPETAGFHGLHLQYTTTSGETCQDSYPVVAYKLESLTPTAVCYDSGTTLQHSDFDLLTMPAGYESTVTFIPATVTTLWRTEEVEVTGSCSDGDSNNAVSTVLVVNKDVKQTTSVAIEIPNYVNDALETIGVGDATDLRMATDFERYSECCSGTKVGSSTSGSATAGLHIDAGPFTIVGIPLPPKIKDYVTLDAMAVTVTGGTDAEINGNYDACQDSTQWSGSGGLAATIEVGGEVKAQSPNEVVVFKGKLSGKSGVSQTLEVESAGLLISGEWSGLNVSGTISLRLRRMTIIEESVHRFMVDRKELLPAYVSLPVLND